MAKKIEFTAKNVKDFISWLKRFSLIDGSLLLEINLPSQEFIAKSYNEERSVVKFSKIKFDKAGFVANKTKDDQRIKVGIYNIQKLIKTLDHFGDEEFSIIFKYEEVISENESDYAGTSILLKNTSLKIAVECTSLNIFKYISDDIFMNRISKVDSLVSFELEKSNINKINSLCDLDRDYKFMEFVNKSKELYARSKTFELLLAVSRNVDVKIDILKDQFEKVDVEDYKVDIGEDRLIFNSNESDTITVVSMVEKDERYEESSPDEDML